MAFGLKGLDLGVLGLEELGSLGLESLGLGFGLQASASKTLAWNDL